MIMVTMIFFRHCPVDLEWRLKCEKFFQESLDASEDVQGCLEALSGVRGAGSLFVTKCERRRKRWKFVWQSLSDVGGAWSCLSQSLSDVGGAWSCLSQSASDVGGVGSLFGKV